MSPTALPTNSWSFASFTAAVFVILCSPFEESDSLMPEESHHATRALSFEDLQAHILAAAAGARLEIWNVQALQNLVTFDRLLSFSVAPSSWKEPYDHHAEIATSYRAIHAVMANEPERKHEEEDALLEIDIEYVLLGKEVALVDLEARVKPLVASLNAALGGEPRNVYYTVSTDYAGSNRAVEAKILDAHATSILEGEFDGSFLDAVARALRALRSA